MNQNQLHQIISYSIFRVIELCFEQGVTTTWRDIYLFLRFPKHLWDDDKDLDDKIIIKSRDDLELMRDMLISRFTIKH